MRTAMRLILPPLVGYLIGMLLALAISDLPRKVREEVEANRPKTYLMVTFTTPDGWEITESPAKAARHIATRATGAEIAAEWNGAQGRGWGVVTYGGKE